MMGGCMTFMGIEGKGKWHNTVIEELLPVTMMEGDDREEHPEGLVLEIDPQSHPMLAGMPEKWPPLLGYNKLAAKADADVVISWKGDPILALGTYGEGRSFAWASDCAPHWMPADFCGSDCNRMLWERVLNWVTKRSL